MADKPTVVTAYKIRRHDGLFSTGGHSPAFAPRGKIWTTIGAVKNHLNQFKGNNYQGISKIYKDCELVILKIETTTADKKPIDAIIGELQVAATKKEQLRQELREKERQSRDLAELARLKKMYE